MRDVMLEKQFYSVKDVSKVLGTSKTFAYSLVNSNGFPAMKVGGKYFVRISDFESWCKRYTGKEFLL